MPKKQWLTGATAELHTVRDTLVVRDRNVKLETYSPVVK